MDDGEGAGGAAGPEFVSVAPREPVLLVLVLDATEYLVDVAAWVPSATPAERRAAAMTRVVQGWLTRSDVVELPVVDRPPLLVNWRAVEFFAVRLPGDVPG